MSLDHHASLESLPTFQSLPTIHRTHLNSKHVQIAILGLKIAHLSSFLTPRVPHDRIAEAVPHDVKTRLAFFEDRRCVLWDLRVNAVYFRSDW